MHNELTLNCSITELVNFSKPKLGLSRGNWSLKIDDRPIREVNDSKSPGVFIDNKAGYTTIPVANGTDNGPV